MSVPFDFNAPLPVARMGEDERLACLRLARSENVGPVSYRKLINMYGGASAALEALPGLAQRGGRRRIRICTVDAAKSELEAAVRIGATLIFTIEPGYPRPLAHLDPPPPLIYALGDTSLFARPAIAIVGSRNCSSAGHAFARKLSGELGEAGFVVVSGLARGVDGAAHTAALDAGTIAVVAGGLDVTYPPEHADLQREIGARGCLVSEMPPGFKPRGKDFPRRNRIISGLVYGIAVIEAARRSGTLITARYGNEQGRTVFAVPGHPLDPRAEGTNNLIKSGATMITTAADIIEAVQPMLRAPQQHVAPSSAPVPSLPRLPPDETSARERDAVQLALGPVPIHVDDLVRATGLSAQIVQVVLLELGLAGRIEHHGEQRVSLRFA